MNETERALRELERVAGMLRGYEYLSTANIIDKSVTQLKRSTLWELRFGRWCLQLKRRAR